MAASTVWSVQIKVLTGSTAPRMFKALGENAKTADTAVGGATKKVKGFGDASKTAHPEVSSLAAAMRALTRATNKLPADLDKSMSRVSAGFGRANRAAGTFARTMRIVSRASSGELRQVDAALNNVRTGANAAAASVRHIATAARSIPRNIKVNTTVNQGSGGGSGAMINPVQAGVAAAGALAGGVLVTGVRGASDLQGTTLQAAIGGGRMGRNLAQTTANMRDTRAMAFKMSTMTGQSLADSMGVVAAMTTAGVSIDQLKSIYKPVAQYTDILHFGKDKMPYDEAAKMGAGIVHDMRFFTPEDTAYGLGRIAQLGYLSPHGTNQLVTQVRRFAPTFENILPGNNRQKATTITELAAWVDRMGNLPFAGSALSQMVTQMIAPRSDRVAKSMVDLGIWEGHMVKGKKGPHMVLDRNKFFDNHTGTFDVMGALHQVGKTYADAKDKGPVVMALAQNTQNAQRIMAALSSKEALTAYDRVVKQRKEMGDDPIKWMNQVQEQLMSQMSPTEQRAASNFQSLATVIGDRLLPVLTPLVAKFADLLQVATEFLDAHPRVAKAAAIGLAGTAGAGMLAALAMGGYVAAGSLKWATKHLHNEGLAHRIGEIGSHSMQVGGVRGLLGSGARFAGGIGGRIASGAFRFTGLGAFGAVGRYGGTFMSGMHDIGYILRSMGPAALRSGGALRLILGVIAKLGLRAIPVVGEVIMLIDTIKFLGRHSHDIGYGIGRAARWIHDHGASMLRDAIVGAFKGGVDMAKGAVKEIPGLAPVKYGANGMPTGVDVPSLLFGPGVGMLWNLGKGVVGGIGEGYNAGNAPPPNVVPLAKHKKAVGMATGGRVMGNGLAFLHKREVVIRDPLVRKLEAMSDHRGRGGRTVRIELANAGGAIPYDHAELRRLAHAIALELSHEVDLDVRSGSGTPQMAGVSHYSITQGSGIDAA
jgi:hypothetical protein